MLNIKPLFEKDSYKPSDKKRPVPTHNTQHPKDARLLHRNGSAIVNPNVETIRLQSSFVKADGTRVVYGRKNEGIRTQRGAIAGLRDRSALASSTAKVTRFVNCQGHTDRRLDVVPVGTFKPVRKRSR